MRKQVDNILEKVLISILGLLVLTVLWQVASRYILVSPSTYTDEIAGFLLIWLGLLGAAYVAGQKGHLAIDLALSNLSDRKLYVVQAITQGLIFGFSLVVIAGGGSWLVYTRFALDVKSAALNLNLGYVYLVLPLSGLLMGYYALLAIVQLKNN